MFRTQFTLDPELIYLNSGTHSICPSAVLDAVTRYQREYERNPTIELFRAWERLWKTQVRLAAFFGADPAELFLRVNVTEAMNAFLLGMPLGKGGEILISDLEYGAVAAIAKFRAKRDELRLRELHLPNAPAELTRLTPARAAELVLSQLGPETRLLILSDVMTSNGLVLPLDEIARETRRRGILLAVDGAHGPGFLPIDLSRSDIDFYGGNLHKWMMGPKGTGFGWVPKRHHGALEPLLAGWTTFETPPHFQAFGGGSRFAAAQLMHGCRDFAPFFALNDLLDFWERNGGRAAISARVRELQLELEARMADALPWPLASPTAESGLRGPLLAYELPERLHGRAPLLFGQLLSEHRLQIQVLQVQGRWILRLSPHVYNSEEELERGVRILAAL